MKKILLVEDDPGNALLMRSIIRRGGFEVVITGSGEEGVERALADHPDLILMDLGLPGIDGHEAARRIRESDGYVPIIAVTSNAMAGDRERTLEAGFDGYIEKPYNPLTVMETIIRIARKAESRSRGTT
jgi:two-component system cell cycle response regulator DivK